METDSILDGLSCELIRERLRRLPGSLRPGAESGEPVRAPVQRAAVLLPLYRLEHGWNLIFIRRAEQAGDRHSGEVGFPGGRWQSSDPDCTATALREAEEEIGLTPARVSVLGELAPFLTVSRFLVTPVVGCVHWPQPLWPNPQEVSRIFSIPLAWLNNPANYRVRPYPRPGHPQARDLVFFDDYDGERLWGVTARITLDFLDRLSLTSGGLHEFAGTQSWAGSPGAESPRKSKR